MKNLVISLFLIASLVLSASILSPAIGQEDLSQEQIDKQAITEKKKVEAKVIQDDPNPNGIAKNWFVGVKGGASFFLSPLKDNPFSWGAGVTVGKQLNTKVALRLDYLYGNLKSDGDFVRENPDGSFYSKTLSSNVDFMEVALLLKLNINDFFYSSSPKYLREFYLFGGGAYTMFRTKITDVNGDFVIGSGYSDTGEEESMTGAMAVPLGIGVTYKLGKKDIVNLNAEFGYRFVQSDKLDGGLTENASNYTFSSLGLLFNLGRPGVTPQKITSDIVKEGLEETLTEQLEKDMDDKFNTQIKPLKEELARQSVDVADNQEQLKILQEEMETRTNAIKEQLTDGQAGGTTYNSSGVGGIDISSIYFAFNSTYITPSMQRDVATIAKVLKKNKKLKCEIVGNSSNVGSPAYNLQLSQKRAEAVMSLLTDEFKISADRLNLVNKGLDDPLAENIKKINRRVDLIIK